MHIGKIIQFKLLLRTTLFIQFLKCSLLDGLEILFNFNVYFFRSSYPFKINEMTMRGVMRMRMRMRAHYIHLPF